MISSRKRGFSKRFKLVPLEKSARLDMAIMLPKLTMVVMAKRLNTNCRQL